MSQKIWLSAKDLQARGLGNRVTIWRRVREGLFPAPVNLSPGMSRWKLADIEAWEAARAAGDNHAA